MRTPGGAGREGLARVSAEKLAEIAVFRRAGQKMSELASLVDLLRRRSLRTVVEIGTDKGGTFWLWCQIAADDATVISIDMPGGDYGDGYTLDDVEVFRRWGGSEQRLHFIREDSHAASTRRQVVDLLGERPIDFLFIDGDHTLEGVTQDFEMYAPLVAADGVVAFHDIVETRPHLDCHASRFWNDVRRRYEHEEFVESGDDLGWRVDGGLDGPWGGIGVLYPGRAVVR